MSKLLFSLLLCAIPLNAFAEYFKCDPEKREEYEIRAEEKDSFAQACLGLMYFGGLGGLSKDRQKAVQYWKLSAAQEDSQGQAYLGMAYFHGMGDLHDRNQGIELLKQSAARNNSLGQAYLGNFYTYGREGLARHYCQLSAYQGDPRGQLCLGKIYARKWIQIQRDCASTGHECLPEEQKTMDSAIEFLTLAMGGLNTGEPEYELGTLYLELGLISNPPQQGFQDYYPQAVSYFSQGALKGNSDATAGLVDMAAIYAEKDYRVAAIGMYELAQSCGVQGLEPTIEALKIPKRSFFSWLFGARAVQKPAYEILNEADLTTLVEIQADQS